MRIRTTISLHDSNHRWLVEKAVSPKGMSELVNRLIYEAKEHGDLQEQLRKADARFDKMLSVLAVDAYQRTGLPHVMAHDYPGLFEEGADDEQD